MIVTLLVLAAVVLSMIAVVASFALPRRVLAFDESLIGDAGKLDAAIKTQRSERITELRRRAVEVNYWPYALLSLALFMQLAALSVDHASHPSIATIYVLPALCIVLIGQASRRRYAKHQLADYLRNSQLPPET
jgi:hypothetical protein